jgi:2-polyprenyl-3-methyl-5-hydroxy-6-metoxy-1,4-benzoquinol methylase
MWSKACPHSLQWTECTSCGHFAEVSGFDRALAKANTLPHELPQWQTLGGQIPKWALTLAMSGASRGSILDFGCGSGAAGFAAEALGCTAYFVDNRLAVLQALNTLGVSAPFAKSKISDDWPKFDIILMGDVVEHFPNPEGWLKGVLQSLLPDGTLILSTPDGSSPVFKGLGGENPYWAEIEHYHIFTRRSMLILADKCGLELVARFPNERYLAGLDWIFRRREGA